MKGDIRLTLNELAEEYKRQADRLYKKIATLKRRQGKCNGTELYEINRRIVILEDMRTECMTLYYKLLHYYDED